MVFGHYFLFMYVILNWRTVARETRNKYGICIYAIRGWYEKMTIIDRTIVHRINTISMDANRLFWKRNWIGEKTILNTKLLMNGRITINGISFPRHMRNTFPKEMMIKIYSTDHTTPKSHQGGAHDGFFNFSYQVFVLVFFMISWKKIKLFFSLYSPIPEKTKSHEQSWESNSRYPYEIMVWWHWRSFCSCKKANQIEYGIS